MIKAIIFDCFGVIYPDTLDLVTRHFKVGPEKRNDIVDVRMRCDKGLISRKEFWEGVADIFGVTPDELHAELDKVRGADWELLEYIRGLKKTYRTAILSNVGSGFLDKIFDHTRPESDYFDVLLPSADIGFMKPSARAYQIAAERLGVEVDECVMIDDQLGHCEGARQAGMQAIQYQGFGQAKAELERLLTATN